MYLWDRIHRSVLPCAASGDMCWCERLWIWCLYAYTASTNTMMHPIMPPATGPTGALLIMFRDATSSSVEEREEKKREERTGRRLFKETTKDFRWLKKWRYNKLISNSSGSDLNSWCHAETFSTSLPFSHQCEMRQRNYSTAERRPILFLKKKKLIREPKKNNPATEQFQSIWNIGYPGSTKVTFLLWYDSESCVLYM